MATEKDPMVCLDMQNYLHTERECLEMWKEALQDDPGDGFSISTMLNDIVNFCYLNKLAQQMGVSKDKLCYMLAGNYRDNDQVLYDLVKALDLSMHPTNDIAASDDAKSAHRNLVGGRYFEPACAGGSLGQYPTQLR